MLKARVYIVTSCVYKIEHTLIWALLLYYSSIVATWIRDDMTRESEEEMASEGKYEKQQSEEENERFVD